jgi:hypothetical protein
MRIVNKQWVKRCVHIGCNRPLRKFNKSSLCSRHYTSEWRNVKKSLKDNRPVICYICGRKMYYLGHHRHKEEYEIFSEGIMLGYVHADCIRMLRNSTK